MLHGTTTRVARRQKHDSGGSGTGRPGAVLHGTGPGRGVRVLAALSLAALLLAAVAALHEPPLRAQSTDVDLVSNLNVSGNLVNLNASRINAQRFTTGDNPEGYSFSDVSILMSTVSANVVGKDIIVRLKEHDYRNNGQPGTEIATLTSPATLTAGGTETFAKPNAELIALEPNTNYWITVNEGLPNPSDTAALRTVTSTDQVSSYNWRIADNRLRKAAPGDPWTSSTSTMLRMRIRGTELQGSDVVQLKSLQVFASNGDEVLLNPGFTALGGSYTASVANEYSYVTVRAETHVTRPIVLHLDQNSNELGSKHSSSTTFQFRANLQPGSTRVINVRVRSGSASRNYQLNVSREPDPGRIVLLSDVLNLKEGENGSFGFVLSREPAESVAVTVTAGTLSNTYTFAPGTWDSPQYQYFSLPADDNSTNESYTFTLTATSDDSTFDGAVSQQFVNADDLTPPNYRLGRIGDSTGLSDELIAQIYAPEPFNQVMHNVAVEGSRWAPTGIWGDPDLDAVWVVDQDGFRIHALKLSELKKGNIVPLIPADPATDYDYRLTYGCHFDHGAFGLAETRGNPVLTQIAATANRFLVYNDVGGRLDVYLRTGSQSCTSKVIGSWDNNNNPVTTDYTFLTPFTYIGHSRLVHLPALHGIWTDGTTVWLSGRGPVDYGIAELDISSSALRGSAHFNHFPNYGIWSDGTTMWVAERDWLRAYELTTGVRSAALDIRLRGDSRTLPPGGIWSDDETIWVTYRTGVLDRYRLPTRSYRPVQLKSPVPRSVPGAEFTASFAESPAAHDGLTRFSVRIEFSHDLESSAKQLRGRLQVSGGRLVDVAPVDQRRDLWDLTFEPDGAGPVSIMLLAGGACGKGGDALCTADQRPLTTSLALQVPGPQGQTADKQPSSQESTTPPQSVPEAPGQLLASARFIGGIELEWDAVRGAEGYEAQVWRRGGWFDLPGDGIQIAFYGAGAIISGLDTHSTLWFRVRAANGHGVSDWSPTQNMNAINEYRLGRLPRPANQPADGAPVIRGAARTGETLWADISEIEDGNGLDRVQFRYQWVAHDDDGDTEIAEATQPTYVWTEADAARRLSVRVSFVDRGGYAESLSSEAVAAAAPINYPASGNLTITGSAQIGETLTAVTSEIVDQNGLTNVSYSYQWLAKDLVGEAEIADATGSTYALTEADLGRRVRVRLTFTDDAGNQEMLSSALTETVTPAVQAQTVNTPATGSVSVGGVPRVGETLNADTSTIVDEDGLEQASFSYAWTRLHLQTNTETEIAGATGSSYTLTDADRDHAVRLSVSFTDDAENEEELHSAWLAVLPPLNHPASGEVTIDGTAQVGETLTADTSEITDEDGLEQASFSYAWTRLHPETEAETVITDATGSSYTLTDADRDHTVRLSVSFTDDAENDEELHSEWLTVLPPANHPASGEVTIDGTVQVGETLTADTSEITDEDGLTKVSYEFQWLADHSGTVTEISDATGSSYTLQASDEGATIQVRVRFTDDRGHQEQLTSAATETVTPAVQAQTVNTPATGSLSVGGVPRVGETLNADTSKIVDEDGLEQASFSYAWTRLHLETEAETVITDATGSSYTLTDADRDHAVRLSVSFTDDAENDEELHSAWLAVLPPLNHPATGDLTITGTPRVGETLNADTSKIVDEDGLEQASFSYAWTRLHLQTNTETEIAGATGSSYTLTDADRDHAVRLSVSFSDDAENEEELHSAWLAVLPPLNHPASGEVTIDGTAQVGETLTADTSKIVDADGLEQASFSYAWTRLHPETEAETVITDATGSSYTLTDADRDHTVRLSVSFTDDAENDEELHSEWLTVLPPANHPASGEVTIDGTVQVGETLTADTSEITDEDGLTKVSYEFQWLADHSGTVTEISDATGSSYTLQASDEGATIQVRVRFTDDRGHQEQLTSAATDAVVAQPATEAPGRPRQLSSAVNPDGSVTLSWEAPAGAAVTGYRILRRRPSQGEAQLLVLVADTANTATEFTDTDVTLGVRHVYRVVAINAGGLSERSNFVHATPRRTDGSPGNRAATGLPSILGSVAVGAVLSVDPSPIEDADGLTNAVYRYQWLISDGGAEQELTGATGSTYTVLDIDRYLFFRLRVSFTDDHGHRETRTSAPTARVP